MNYLEVTEQQYGFFDPSQAAKKGSELKEQYISADPFPHIVLDEFCSPEALDACIDYFPDAPDPNSRVFERDQEKFKTSFNPDYLTPALRSFFYSLNSRPFLQFLENLTGVTGLIPDPYFVGGGFHQTNQGGHLDVHADFNLHRHLGLERRLNVLIYLNKGWQEEYGGNLELWKRDMSKCVQRVAPIYNRCVVFSTDSTSFHGHPQPIAHPNNTPRRSIALYYYTATWKPTSKTHTTQFKARPNSTDSTDWKVKRGEFFDDVLPPILMRNFRKIGHKINN